MIRTARGASTVLQTDSTCLDIAFVDNARVTGIVVILAIVVG